MPKPQAPKANTAPEAETAKPRDVLLERLKAQNPNSNVYRNHFGSIVIDHKVKR
jgi:hypothetical protein